MRVTIFEAADRLGGKIHSKPFQLASASYEAGAAAQNGCDGFVTEARALQHITVRKAPRSL